MENHKWEVIEAGCDYVTLTAKTNEGIARLAGWANVQFGIQGRLGNKSKPVAPMGYTGWQCGPVFGGSRADGYMLRVSGSLAHQAFYDCYSYLVNITRLDLQFTARCSENYEQFGEHLAFATPEHRKTLDGANWPSLLLLYSFGYGDTLQIGKRACRNFGRIYNKWVESGDEKYRNCWRFEVELGRKVATVYADYLINCKDPQRIGVSTFDKLIGWGLPLPSLGFPLGGVPLSVGAPMTDAERKLAWIKKQVTPTIRWLQENGYSAAVDEWHEEWNNNE